MAKEQLDLKPYTGHWVAIVRGQVVASGNSAHETWMHCRAVRLKDEPILKFIPLPIKKSSTRK